ncbi:MAG: 50S ribosomal protein L24 [Chloroflexota bacterium]|nr:50S ribosomal protein L24 [Chloroflexota bacterium]
MYIRKSDEVLVIAGDDRGKKGKVHGVFPREQRILVEGVNMSKRHMKAQRNIRQTGVIERESPIHVSNVMLICPKCNKSTTAGFRALKDKSKVRVCKRCREVID